MAHDGESGHNSTRANAALVRAFQNVSSKEDPDNIYQLMEHIGTGSYGEVYKAKRKDNGLLVAVKIIRLEVGEDLEEVLNEVNFLKRNSPECRCISWVLLETRHDQGTKECMDCNGVLWRWKC